MKRRKRRTGSILPALALVLALLIAPGCSRTADESAASASPFTFVRKVLYREGQLTAETFPVPEGYTSVVLVGDIMTWDKTKRLLEKHGAGYPFRATAGLLQSADLTVGNLEGPVAVDAELKRTRYPYKVPPWTLDGLVWAGFDQLSVANNHFADCKRPGMLETMKYVDEYKMGYFGGGGNKAEAMTPRVVDVNGIKIALVGAVTGESYLRDLDAAKEKNAYKKRERRINRDMGARKNKPGAVVATPRRIRKMIRAARRQADVVIFFPHWGIRYHRPPSDFQREMAHAAIDAGADLIVGHHCHFWQPVEVYKDKPIVYGVGNFAFGSGNRRADAGLLVRALIKDKKVAAIELFPTYTKNSDRRVRYQTKLKKGEFALAALADLKAQSAPLNAEVVIEGDKGVLRFE